VQPWRVIVAAIGHQYMDLLPDRCVITETGYTTAAVSEAAQAIYILNAYLDAFHLGIRTTFVYELSDAPWEQYGLFRQGNSPKPAADAVHNLTTLLADGDTPIASPGSLTPIFSGLPATARWLLLQKSDASFALLLWNEPPIWNGTSDLNVSPVAVQIDCGTSFGTLSCYDLITGLTPVSQLADSDTITVQLGKHPLLIELVPAPAG
jgi:hypothetical protein